MNHADFRAKTKNKIDSVSVFCDARDCEGLYCCLSELGLRRGDIVAIEHPSFNAFKSDITMRTIEALVFLGVVMVAGIGHANDAVALDAAVSHSTITPTDAAIQVLDLVRGNTAVC